MKPLREVIFNLGEVEVELGALDLDYGWYLSRKQGSLFGFVGLAFLGKDTVCLGSLWSIVA
jgi:hypothetical protein